ncbi:MAG: LexA family protein [Kiritimatiellia bacterium]|nr:translesion error-prone DNA polymerase V autoproteolytic subunit [Lentisphaerota bacterium]
MIAAIHPARQARACARPLCGTRVAAGFPSPADDYMEGALDLNEYLVRNPPATFFFRVTGESMRDAGILPNDLLVVDRSIEPRNGQVVIAVLDGELTVKRLWQCNEQMELHAANPEFAPIRIADGRQLDIWGVVKYAIHQI